MNKQILWIFLASIMLLLISACQAPQQPGVDVTTPEQPAAKEPTPTAPVVQPKTEAPVMNKEPLIGDDASGDSAFHIYIKDAPGLVRYLEAYVKKVEAVRAADGQKLTLFEGRQKIRLDAETTTRIGRGKVASGVYSEVRVELDSTGKIRFMDGTEASVKVKTPDIKSKIDYALRKGYTANVIIDLALKSNIRQEKENGNIVYIFEPPIQNPADSPTLEQGINLQGALGNLPTKEEARIGVVHLMGDVEVIIPSESLNR